MVEVKRGMPAVNIKHKGFIDVSKLIQSIKAWFSDNEYTLHFPKQKFKGPTGSVEQELEMYGERKITDYVKFKIELLIRLYDLKDVEVIRDGKKIKTCTGRITIDLGGTMHLDYRKRFGGNKTLQYLQDIYHKYVIRTTIEDVWEDELLLQIVELGKLIRKQFQHEAIS